MGLSSVTSPMGRLFPVCSQSTVAPSLRQPVNLGIGPEAATNGKEASRNVDYPIAGSGGLRLRPIERARRFRTRIATLPLFPRRGPRGETTEGMS